MKRLKILSFSVAVSWICIYGGYAAQDPTFTNGISLKALPTIQEGNYKVDPYIEGAAAMQVIGKEKAVEQLIVWAQDSKDTFMDFERISVLCRMLFTSKTGSDFERPELGAPLFLDRYPMHEGNRSDDPGFKTWPLEPIELVDGVPFAIVAGYSYEGPLERKTLEMYVRYCKMHCEWSNTRFKKKTREEKQAALQKLIASPKWEAKLGRTGAKLLARQVE